MITTQQMYHVTIDGEKWIVCPLCAKRRFYKTAWGLDRHVQDYHQQGRMIGWIDA